MTALADKLVAWATKNYMVKGGQPFSIEGREWVRDEFFRPALGWRLWARNPQNLCESCRERDGEFVDWSPELVRSLNAHRNRSKKCEGLRLLPVTFTAQNLMRGDGKTTNAFALIAAALADPELAPLHIQFMASAGSQTETLIEENLLQPIEANRTLMRKFSTRGKKVIFDHGKRGKSYVEFVDSSHGSNTGRRRGILFYDECRDIGVRKVVSMLPSIRATSRFYCPHGHGSRDYEPDKVFKCPTCKEPMLPFVPRVWMVSTSGLDDGNEQWWNEFVSAREENPVGSVYLHRSDESLNPSASKHEMDAIEEAFSGVDAAQDVLQVELRNAAVKPGNSFVTKHQLRLVTDSDLTNLPGSSWPCVGFLDTSWSGDLTTLMIAGYDPDECETPWQTLRVLHWAIWEPKTLAGGVIDPTLIQAHLDKHMPLFPGLVTLLVDDRGREWAKTFVKWNNKERAAVFGRRIKGYHARPDRKRGWQDNPLRRSDLVGNEEDRNAGWEALWTRIAMTAAGHEQIAIPPKSVLPELHAELLGVVWEEDKQKRLRVTDRSRKRQHADVADALAGCCLLAFKEQVKPKTSSLLDLQNSRAASAFSGVFGRSGRLTGSLTDDMF